jgi:hypothetical protein
MTDRKQIARMLVAESAVLNVLQEANAATRTQAKGLYESGDADSVKVDGVDFGRVRRDKPTVKLTVVDPEAFEEWVKDVAPDEWVPVYQVRASFRAAVLKDGQYVDADGVVHVPDGLGKRETPGNLVVSATPAATEWARALVTEQLKAVES